MSRTDCLLWIDEIRDRELASDGVSRYGAYLRQAAHRFLGWDDQPTSDPALFAASAFEISCSPVMSPPYVHTHPRLVDVVPHCDEDRRRALQVSIAIEVPAAIRGVLPSGWRGWQQTGTSHRTEGHRYEPWDNDRPTVCTRLIVRLPFPSVDRLPAPAYDRGEPHTPTAQYAVRVLVGHANTQLGDLLAAITTNGGWS